MKIAATLLAAFIGCHVFAQSQTEAYITKLSNDKFRWLQQGKFDSVANLLDDRLVSVHTNGATQSKTEYLEYMKKATAVYDTVDLRETTVRVYGNTAILVAKGRFVITMNKKQAPYNLVYTEVYVLESGLWKLASRQTTQAPN